MGEGLILGQCLLILGGILGFNMQQSLEIQPFRRLRFSRRRACALAHTHACSAYMCLASGIGWAQTLRFGMESMGGQGEETSKEGGGTRGGWSNTCPALAKLAWQGQGLCYDRAHAPPSRARGTFGGRLNTFDPAYYSRPTENEEAYFCMKRAF